MAGLGFGRDPEVLETLLGSCVGIAIWDRVTRQGGLAHIVLGDSQGSDGGSPGKYADTAIPALRQELVQRGAFSTSLTAKIAGGSTMFGPKSSRDVGLRNHAATVACLKKYGIPLLAEHIGGTQGRIIRFNLADGSVEVRIGREIVAVI